MARLIPEPPYVNDPHLDALIAIFINRALARLQTDASPGAASRLTEDAAALDAMAKAFAIARGFSLQDVEDCERMAASVVQQYSGDTQ